MSHVLLTVLKNEQSTFKHAVHDFLLMKVFVNTALFVCFTTSVCLQRKDAFRLLFTDLTNMKFFSQIIFQI